MVTGLLVGVVAWGWAQTTPSVPTAKNPPRVEVNASRLKNTRIKGGDWDDRLEKVQLEMTARNLDLNRPAGDLRLHYWILAESQIDTDKLQVIDAGKLDLTLTSDSVGRQYSHVTSPVTLRWDNTNAVFGERYKGWIVALTNPQDELIQVKSSLPAWQARIARLFTLGKGTWCTRDLTPAESPSRY